MGSFTTPAAARPTIRGKLTKWAGRSQIRRDLPSLRLLSHHAMKGAAGHPFFPSDPSIGCLKLAKTLGVLNPRWPWAGEKEGFVDGVGTQRIDVFCRATDLSTRPPECVPRLWTAEDGGREANARPLGVVRSSASLSETKPSRSVVNSWSVRTRSTSERPPEVQPPDQDQVDLPPPLTAARIRSSRLGRS
jgi:hypothetical protein